MGCTTLQFEHRNELPLRLLRMELDEEVVQDLMLLLGLSAAAMVSPLLKDTRRWMPCRLTATRSSFIRLRITISRAPPARTDSAATNLSSKPASSSVDMEGGRKSRAASRTDRRYRVLSSSGGCYVITPQFSSLARSRR